MSVLVPISPESPGPADTLGVADGIKGQIPRGLLVLKAGVEREHAEICNETVQLVRERVGPGAVFSMRSSGLRSDA